MIPFTLKSSSVPHTHPFISPLLSLTLIHPQVIFRPAHSSTLKPFSFPHTNPLISPLHVPHHNPPSSPFPSLNLIHSQASSVPHTHPLICPLPSLTIIHYQALFRPSHLSTPKSSPVLPTQSLTSPLPSFPPSHNYTPSLFLTPIYSQTLSRPSSSHPSTY